jgi:hypothetical protein
MTLIVRPDVWKPGVTETGEVCQVIPLNVLCRTSIVPGSTYEWKQKGVVEGIAEFVLQ